LSPEAEGAKDETMDEDVIDGANNA
jgi:hypothetical protein